MVTQLDIDNSQKKMSPLVTQFESSIFTFCKRILSKINWTHHLLILSKTKGIEEKLYYLFRLGSCPHEPKSLTVNMVRGDTNHGKNKTWNNLQS